VNGATDNAANGFKQQMTQHFWLFQTTIGTGGVTWGEAGITGVQLPETDVAHVRVRLRRRFPGVVETTPPPAIQAAIERIVALLSGERTDDLAGIELDLTRVPEFAREVYAVARRIRPGETRTYGQVATELGDPLLARDVGQALARNPFPIIVPCHRVLAAGGKLGGFSAAGGVQTKQRLLAIERANVAWQLPLAP
jgi:methylated-DNA-[protein]-cysteine S-methyltransferase